MLIPDAVLLSIEVIASVSDSGLDAVEFIACSVSSADLDDSAPLSAPVINDESVEDILFVK